MNGRTRWLGALVTLLALVPLTAAPRSAWSPTVSTTAAYGPELEGFDYPHPVQRFTFVSQRQTLHMAYMDVRPAVGNGRTAVLLHGKNYCAATW